MAFSKPCTTCVLEHRLQNALASCWEKLPALLHPTAETGRRNEASVDQGVPPLCLGEVLVGQSLTEVNGKLISGPEDRPYCFRA